MSRVTIPEVLERFRAYKRRNGGWASLHVVLDDGNVKNGDVVWCISHAKERGDAEGEALGWVLMVLSRTQRRKLGNVA